MEGQLLSAGSARGEDAAVLCRPVSDRRDQLHVLPDAERKAGRRLGCSDTGALHLKKDLALFDAFLADLPPKAPAAFEFRHQSWLDDEIVGRLAGRHLALCVADSEKMSTPVRVTADYAYFRLRDEGYTAEDIERWAEIIGREAAACADVYVYFKHEEAGKGPEFARLLGQRLGVAVGR